MILDKLAKFCIEKDSSAITELDSEFQQQEASKSQTTVTRLKTGVDRKQLYAKKRNKIEEFFIFDIDKDNALPNKENQRLLASFDITEMCL